MLTNAFDFVDSYERVAELQVLEKGMRLGRGTASPVVNDFPLLITPL